ncbi:MAG: hypothetical protein LC730_06115, partial [Acidobacteria bacterium]|nr:hypothetical protein [Acidobacteriota bacterium]MCA1609015.1 hypothetical protein [Acidobacteriota bacterium]
VVPGRIVTQGRSAKRLFLVLNVNGEKVSAMRDDGHGTSFALSRVSRVFENTYPLDGDKVEQAFLDAFDRKNTAIEEPKLSFARTDADAASEIITGLINKLVQQNHGEIESWAAQEILWETWPAAERIHRIGRDVEFLRARIWEPFERRARVLDYFGYLNFAAEKVTETGKWLADVRVDRPLLVGEALRHGLFDKLNIETAAGLMAALAADADRNYGELYLSNRLLDKIGEFEEIVYDVSNVEWKNNIEPAEEINLSAAAAAEHWARGTDWPELVSRTAAEEGDLFRLLARTGEALLQIANLRGSNSTAAAVARGAAEAILREPVR